MNTIDVGFLGGGQMATALAGGAVAEGVIAEAELAFAEPNTGQRANLAGQFPHANLFSSAAEMVGKCSRLVLAVKPHVLRELAPELAKLLNKSTLVVSIAAGIPLEELQHTLKTDRVVRVMPNTPSLVGAGASGYSADHTLSTADLEWVERLLTSVGTCHRVPDHLIHAVTGVSGSGPAYAYMIIEALSDGGVAAGLPRDMAIQLAAQTLLGAAEMVLQTQKHPGVLKDQVTSPGGTTIAAIRSLEASGLRGAMIEAVLAAAHRSEELGQER